MNTVAHAQGSGLLFKTEEQNGYVVTNQHVVSHAATVTVTVGDDTDYTGTVVGADAERDLAVVRICCNAAFPTADFGDSADLRVGDEVFAVGYPRDQSIPKEQQAEPKVIVARAWSLRRSRGASCRLSGMTARTAVPWCRPTPP